MVEKKKRKKIFDLFSKEEEIQNIIDDMKLNSKVYLKLISGLQILGNFDGKVEVEIYDEFSEDKGKKVRLWCSDLDNNLFVFYGISFDRNDLLKITKETNEESLEYDISLAKKFNIDSNNINFTMTSKIFGFKFGRLITNEKNFYSLFLRDDVGYQIQGNFSENISQELLNELNKFETVPKLSEYLSILEKILYIKQVDFSKMAVFAYKDFKNIGSLQFNDEDKNIVLKKTK